MASTTTSTSYSYHNYLFFLLVLELATSCYGFGTFGFDIHHRYSDPVKGILAVDELPERGSLPYYAVMARRDSAIHSRRGRQLSTADNSTSLTFFNGNETLLINFLGFLHYANVSVGTPSLSFLVALDTGSDLFWLPCDCSSCVHGLSTSNGQQIELNIYSPNASSTSEKVSCDSSLCSQQQSQCSSAQNNCPYQVLYLSNGTSSSGYLVEDVLHLITDDTQSKSLDARITFGCGQIQTGSFLDGAAPNGLFGLGMDNVSVPSILASGGNVSNSFSMCFGPDGIGRISFGDNGSSDQGETPFNLRHSHPTYNISITEIIVDENGTKLESSAIFDSGTSFTYLNDPGYAIISDNFNKLAKEQRHPSTSDLPFEYCYDMSANQSELEIPTVVLVMEGGDQFNVTDPIVLVSLQGNQMIYCLGVVKSGDVNIIGQNFMTGYRLVFDRERNILGWKPSDCYDSKSLPISPTSSTVPPATAVNPEAAAGSDGNSRVSPLDGSPSSQSTLSALPFLPTMIIFPFLAIV